MVFRLDSLTHITLCHEPGDITFYPSPPILVSNIHVHLGGSEMDEISRVMGFIHDGILEMTLLWHTKPLLEP
jgi:hypothetical protein